jgi:hypothetical protein
MYQHTLTASGGSPSWLVGGHAHLGVLSILAIALGIVVDLYDVTGRVRTATQWLFVIGQWLLPLTIWVGVGMELFVLMPTVFLWGLFLIVSMLLMAYHFATGAEPPSRPSAGTPADD